MDRTKETYVPGISAMHIQQSPDIQVIRGAMEGIFSDLIRGIRVEEILGPTKTLIGLDYQDTVAGKAPSGVVSAQSFPLEKTGVDLIDDIARAELVEAMFTLKAAYWFDHQKSDLHPPFSHFAVSHPRKHQPIQRTDPLSKATSPVCSQNTNIASGPSAEHLLPTFIRYHQFSKTCGWKLLSLLSLSRKFRSAAENFTRAQWISLLKMITENSASFELIIKTTRPKYGAILVDMFQDLGVTESIMDSPSKAWMAAINWTYTSASIMGSSSEWEDLQNPMTARYLNHPHRWFVTLDKNSIVPVTPVYTPISHSIIQPGVFPPKYDPRCIDANCRYSDELEGYRRVVCDICEANGATECDSIFKISFPEPLVELIETDGKGIGVRSLEAIPKGKVLGEYAGLVCIDAIKGDVYALNGHLGNTDENFYLTTSLHYGNFTRFVNHSCSANCFLTAMDFRGKKISVLMAIKDIEIFDEVTADYGEEYFLKRGMKCRCGVQGCKIG